MAACPGVAPISSFNLCRCRPQACAYLQCYGLPYTPADPCLQVAVKLMKVEASHTDVAEFMQEAHMLTEVEHPRCLQVKNRIPAGLQDRWTGNGVLHSSFLCLYFSMALELHRPIVCHCSSLEYAWTSYPGLSSLSSCNSRTLAWYCGKLAK